MKKKLSYKVRNWRAYNQALINRGNLTIWFDEEAIAGWYATKKKAPGRGRPFIYSDDCIELALTLRSLFHFPLRSTQGFMQGLINLLGCSELKIPHYSSLSRRAGNLEISISHKAKKDGVTDMAVDSTGLKIYGEGEWKMRTHGKDTRRTWRKLHIAMDPDDHQCLRMELTKASVHDDQMMEPLLAGLKEIGSLYADGAYISKNCFGAIAGCGAKARISLRTGTSIAKTRGDPGLEERNCLVREIQSHGGKVAWKKATDYHRRSNVETYMYRFKTILGAKLASRNFKNQITEARVKVQILNRMTQLGMPESYPAS